MNSIDCSRVIGVTGTNLTASSEPEALVFVSFFPLQTFISKSSALEHSPTTIPWYTGQLIGNILDLSKIESGTLKFV